MATTNKKAVAVTNDAVSLADVQQAIAEVQKQAADSMALVLAQFNDFKTNVNVEHETLNKRAIDARLLSTEKRAFNTVKTLVDDNGVMKPTGDKQLECTQSSVDDTAIIKALHLTKVSNENVLDDIATKTATQITALFVMVTVYCQNNQLSDKIEKELKVELNKKLVAARNKYGKNETFCAFESRETGALTYDAKNNRVIFKDYTDNAWHKKAALKLEVANHAMKLGEQPTTTFFKSTMQNQLAVWGEIASLSDIKLAITMLQKQQGLISAKLTDDAKAQETAIFDAVKATL